MTTCICVAVRWTSFVANLSCWCCWSCSGTSIWHSTTNCVTHRSSMSHIHALTTSLLAENIPASASPIAMYVRKELVTVIAMTTTRRASIAARKTPLIKRGTSRTSKRHVGSDSAINSWADCCRPQCVIAAASDGQRPARPTTLKAARDDL
jgi:hypothetical protein